MKIINPNFEPAAAPHIARKAAVLACLAECADKRDLSFDDVRSHLGLTAKQLPDGSIHQICQDAGITVMPVEVALPEPVIKGGQGAGK